MYTGMAKNTFVYSFEVRWSDIDANRHLANSSYMVYTAQTRMAFMNRHKMGVAQLNRWGIGPVILYEQFVYFKEILADQTVYVTLEISGMSDDASIYEFVHHFYLKDGTHCASSKVLGVWIDTMLRKATTPPEDILQVMEAHKDESVRTLTRDDLKNLDFRPQNISPEEFQPNLK